MVNGLETIRRINNEAARKGKKGKNETKLPHAPWEQKNTPWTLTELRSVRGTPEYEVYRQFAVAGEPAVDEPRN